MNAPGHLTRPRARDDGWESLAFVAVLGILGFGFLLWATGEVSGLLATGERPGASFSEMGKVVVRLFERTGDPKSAWPKALRSNMAGPVLFYGVFVLLLAAAALAAFALDRIFKGSFSDGRRGSSWASIGDLRPLIVRHPVGGRLTLGRVGGKLVAAEERQSVIVLGPTQSMKTSGFAIPAILEWQGPVLATSVKADLLRNTIDARRDVGDVWVYDPTSSSRTDCSSWSPLASCHTWHGAQRAASWLAGAAPAAWPRLDTRTLHLTARSSRWARRR